MKKIIFITLLAFIITGCNKQPEQAASEQSDNPTITAQFEQSDEKISKYLDQLDDPNTSIEQKKKILCTDYPLEYKENYMPNLLKMSPNDYTKEKLLTDLDTALNYYKEKENIRC